MRRYSFHNFILALNKELPWETIEDVYDILKKQYSEPHRFYHTWKHIEQGWSELEPIKCYFQDPCEAEFAWYFHDYIYVPGNTDNEKRSAEEAIKYCIQFGLDESFQKKVISFIIDPPITTDQKIFRDIDYSILGQVPSKYREYTESIRKEYLGFPLSLRLNFLQSLKEPIFLTKLFQDKYEQTAQKNIATEITGLKTAGTVG